MEILYEDNHVIVVIKEPGILSQGDITGHADMLSLIKNYLKIKYNKKGNIFLALLHRLDRMVGGIMVFAKTSKAAKKLNEQIRSHMFIKKYLATVHGKINTDGILTNYLYKDKSLNMVYVKDEPGLLTKKAVLRYDLIDCKDGLSLLKITLITGRTHQIRVQLANIGHPILGDKKYGIKDNHDLISLYAYMLAFNHPITGELKTFTHIPSTYPYTLFKR